jgi:hypothetical protein
MGISRSTALPSRTAGWAVAIWAVLYSPAGFGAPTGHERVIVLNFAGPQGKAAQAQVTARLRRDYGVLSQLDFQRAAREVARDKSAEEAVAAVAKKLHAVAVLAGVVKHAASRWELILMVREGGTGSVLDRLNIPFDGTRLDKTALAQIDGELLPILARASQDAPPERVVRESSDNEVPTDIQGGAVPAGGGTSPQGQVDRHVTAPRTRPPWRPYLSLALGAGGMGRSLGFTDNPTLTLQGYSGGLVATLDFAFEFYPFAAVAATVRGLGLYLNLDRALAISSTLKQPNMPPATLDSTEMVLTGGVKFGYRLREDATAPTFGARAGYGITSFEISVPMTVTIVSVPDVSYHYVEVGPFAEVPFHLLGYLWQVDLKAAYLLVLDSGQIGNGGRNMTIAMGPNGSTSGVEVGLGLKWNVQEWLNLRTGFELERFGTNFTTGASAASASDLYYGLKLQAGISY